MTRCQLYNCNKEATMYCFYTIKSDGEGRTYHSYRFCESHGGEIRRGEWEDKK